MELFVLQNCSIQYNLSYFAMKADCTSRIVTRFGIRFMCSRFNNTLRTAPSPEAKQAVLNNFFDVTRICTNELSTPLKQDYLFHLKISARLIDAKLFMDLKHSNCI